MRRVGFLAGLVALLMAVPWSNGASGHEFHEFPPLTLPPIVPGSTAALPLLGQANPGTGANADVYGFKNHAYLASFLGRTCLSKGVRVYDLADPRTPRLESSFADAASEPALAGTWTEKVIVQQVVTREFRGDVAVVSFQPCGGLTSSAFRGFGLYDVTDPAHPRKLALYSTPRARGSHEIWLDAKRGKAYVYTAVILSELTTSPDFNPATGSATTPGTPDFRIIDVSDPTAPVQVGAWGAWKELGVYPVSAGHQNFVHSVRVDEQLRRAFLSYWDLGTVILDIADPAHPRYLGRTSPPQGATHSSYVTEGGRQLVETHELDDGLPYIYDIADPAHPVLLGSFDPPNSEISSVHDPKVRGSSAYFSWYNLGVVLADIQTPSRPELRAQFIPNTDYLNPDFFCFQACAVVWGVFVDRNYVLASDMNSGLYVLELNPR
jgi:hypothetical protein